MLDTGRKFSYLLKSRSAFFSNGIIVACYRLSIEPALRLRLIMCVHIGKNTDKYSFNTWVRKTRFYTSINNNF